MLPDRLEDGIQSAIERLMSSAALNHEEASALVDEIMEQPNVIADMDRQKYMMPDEFMRMIVGTAERVYPSIKENPDHKVNLSGKYDDDSGYDEGDILADVILYIDEKFSEHEIETDQIYNLFHEIFNDSYLEGDMETVAEELALEILEMYTGQ